VSARPSIAFRVPARRPGHPPPPAGAAPGTGRTGWGQRPARWASARGV